MIARKWKLSQLDGFLRENSLLLAPMKSDAAISRPDENGVPRGLKWNAHRAEVMKICGMKCFF